VVPALRRQYPSCSCRTHGMPLALRPAIRECSARSNAAQSGCFEHAMYCGRQTLHWRRPRPRCVEALLRMANQEQASPGNQSSRMQRAEHWNIFSRPAHGRGRHISLDSQAHPRNPSTRAMDKPVWMGEDSLHIADLANAADRQGAVLREGVRHCDAYIAVIIDKHGSSVE